ncbi:MAG: dienelactone hydrolase family protein [Candidatus Eremiobacteraeota bacterium]|nr:dienelactone hydrolase family protein [Candidatus Eremiobacteraeota bacterium]
MTRTLVSRTLVWLIALALLVLAFQVIVPMRVSAQTHAVAREGRLAFGGMERTYRLYRPAALARDAMAPVVLVLHGGYGNGTGAERAYHWDEAADAHGFVVLYPDGFLRAWNAGACCGQPVKRNIDDVAFLTALVEQTMRDERIDPHRVYVTGISNGAMMAYRLACESPFAFAAIGPVAGTFSKTCEHPKPISVLAIHGSDDKNVPLAGGSGSGVDRSPRPSLADVLAQWRNVDRCSAPRVREAPPVRYEIADCPSGRTVESIVIAGAGHQWPGSEKPPPAAVRLLGLEQPSRALDATATLWEFFAAHRT